MTGWVIIHRDGELKFVAEANPDESFSLTNHLDQARVWPDIDSAASTLHDWIGASVSFYLDSDANHASIHLIGGDLVYEAIPLDQATIEDIMSS